MNQNKLEPSQRLHELPSLSRTRRFGLTLLLQLILGVPTILLGVVWFAPFDSSLTDTILAVAVGFLPLMTAGMLSKRLVSYYEAHHRLCFLTDALSVATLTDPALGIALDAALRRCTPDYVKRIVGDYEFFREEMLKMPERVYHVEDKLEDVHKFFESVGLEEQRFDEEEEENEEEEPKRDVLTQALMDALARENCQSCLPEDPCTRHEQDPD